MNAKYQQLVDSIDTRFLANAIGSKKSQLVASVRNAVIYEIAKLSQLDTLTLTVDAGSCREKLDPTRSLRYARALHSYMKGNTLDGKRVDSFVSPYVIMSTKREFTEFFSSAWVVDKLSEVLKEQLSMARKVVLTQAPDSNRGDALLALDAILEGNITEFVRNIVVSQSFQEAMTEVLNEISTGVIHTAVVTAIVSSLVVFSLSVRVGTVAWMLIPAIAFIIAYQLVTFKSTFSKKISEKIAVAVDQELYEDASLKVACVFKEAVVSRIADANTCGKGPRPVKRHPWQSQASGAMVGLKGSGWLPRWPFLGG